MRICIAGMCCSADTGGAQAARIACTPHASVAYRTYRPRPPSHPTAFGGQATSAGSDFLGIKEPFYSSVCWPPPPCVTIVAWASLFPRPLDRGVTFRGK